MAQTARKEDSVLVSLKALKGLEDDRVRGEREDAERRVEAQRQAAAEAERQARETLERARREAEDAERRRLDAAERQVREEQLRLEEAERRARIDAQARLEETRIKAEVEAQAIHGAKKKPTVLIAVSSLLFLAVAGLGVFAYAKHQEKLETERRNQIALQQAEEANKKLQTQLALIGDENAKVDQQIDAALAGLKAARDEAARKQYEQQIADLKEKKKANIERAVEIKRKHDANPAAGLILCGPNEPMCNEKK